MSVSFRESRIQPNLKIYHCNLCQRQVLYYLDRQRQYLPVEQFFSGKIPQPLPFHPQTWKNNLRSVWSCEKARNLSSLDYVASITSTLCDHMLSTSQASFHLDIKPRTIKQTTTRERNSQTFHRFIFLLNQQSWSEGVLLKRRRVLF